MPKYKLVNPLIMGGEFKNSIKADDENKAVETFYHKITELSTNQKPLMYMTI